MSYILWILKFVGIVLLVILGLLLLVLLTVLFVPLRYRLDGEYRDGIRMNASVSWLLHLLSVRISYEEELAYSVRIAGIKLFPRKKREKKPKKSGGGQAGDGRKEDSEVRDSDSEKVTIASPETAGKQSGESEAQPGKSVTQPGKQEESTEKTDHLKEPEGAGQESEKKESESSSSGRHSSLTDKFRAVGDKIKALISKFKNLKDKVSGYLEILRREETKQLISLVVSQLKNMIRHILPRNLDVRFVIGLDNPELLGQIMAVQGILYPILRGSVVLIPDFEEKHIEGTFHASGHIRVFTLMICLLRVVINQNFRKLLKILRNKGGKQNGGE